MSGGEDWQTTRERLDRRAAWILNRYGWALFQRRRGQLIRKLMWEVDRELAGANPSQFAEVVTAPLHERPITSRAVAKEYATVIAGLVFLPLAWIGGRLLYKLLARLVPRKAIAYPITPLAAIAGGLSAAVALGMWLIHLTVLEWAYVPFLIAQIPGVFFIAALYGILEGWLGVQGSTDWWPEAQKPLETLDFEFLEPDVLNAPPMLPQAEREETGHWRVPEPPKALDIFRSHKRKR